MNPDATRAVLRLRSLAPHGINGVQVDVIDRLRRLESDGRIADLDVDVWGASMAEDRPVDRTPSEPYETVSEFERWGDEHGCTLRPALRRRYSGSDSDRPIIRLPLLCLGVYEGEAISAVYPHVDDGDVRTVHDGIEALESPSRSERGGSEYRTKPSL